jgi:hypothetical protein
MGERFYRVQVCHGSLTGRTALWQLEGVNGMGAPRASAGWDLRLRMGLGLEAGGSGMADVLLAMVLTLTHRVEGDGQKRCG